MSVPCEAERIGAKASNVFNDFFMNNWIAYHSAFTDLFLPASNCGLIKDTMMPPGLEK